MISRSGVPIGSSYVPGRTTWPETQKSFGPGLFSGPIERNQSAPRSTMCGTQASVSTLLTMVGQPKSP